MDMFGESKMVYLTWVVGTLEGIWEVADSSAKTPHMASLVTIRLLPWWLVFCKETRWLLRSPWRSCRIHTWWTHFCCILLAAPELLACPHSREVSWILPLDRRLMVTLQKAEGWKAWLWSSIMSNLLCKSSRSYKYRERLSGEGC